MALLATSFTVEIVLLIIGLYLFDGGLIRKLSAEGLFVNGLNLSYRTQRYVTDTTQPPTNVSLLFTPEISQAMVIMFALLSLITLAWTFVEIAKVVKFRQTNKDLQDLFDIMV